MTVGHLQPDPAQLKDSRWLQQDEHQIPNTAFHENRMPFHM